MAHISLDFPWLWEFPLKKVYRFVVKKTACPDLPSTSHKTRSGHPGCYINLLGRFYPNRAIIYCICVKISGDFRLSRFQPLCLIRKGFKIHYIIWWHTTIGSIHVKEGVKNNQRGITHLYILNQIYRTKFTKPNLQNWIYKIKTKTIQPIETESIDI